MDRAHARDEPGKMTVWTPGFVGAAAASLTRIRKTTFLSPRLDRVLVVEPRGTWSWWLWRVSAANSSQPVRTLLRVRVRRWQHWADAARRSPRRTRALL